MSSVISCIKATIGSRVALNAAGGTAGNVIGCQLTIIASGRAVARAAASSSTVAISAATNR